MSDIITVEGFEKSYGTVRAVRGISFSVREGILFAFLGPNGAGKSTTIDTLCTLLRLQKGHVVVNGYELGRDDEAIRKSIGIVFQKSLLDRDLTVRENLMLRGALYISNRNRLKERVAEVTRITGLEEFLDRRYRRLSGGQVRRADIARALIAEPKLLFMDEPMTGLDPKTREDIWKMLGHMQEHLGMTIFLTTHYMEEAANADDVVIINHGKIVEEGTPAVLKEKYTRDYMMAYGYDGALPEVVKQNGYDFIRRNDGLQIIYRGKEDALKLIGLTQAHVENFEIKMGTMDEMFLSIIGREENDTPDQANA